MSAYLRVSRAQTTGLKQECVSSRIFDIITKRDDKSNYSKLW